MKKIKLFTMIALVCCTLISCNKENSNEYAGTYSGAMSMTGLDKSINAKLTFISIGQDNLTLYGMQLTKISSSTYTANGEGLKAIVALITSDSFAQMENVKATFTFSGNQVTMKLSYNVIGLADLTIITFEGEK